MKVDVHTVIPTDTAVGVWRSMLILMQVVVVVGWVGVFGFQQGCGEAPRCKVDVDCLYKEYCDTASGQCRSDCALDSDCTQGGTCGETGKCNRGQATDAGNGPDASTGHPDTVTPGPDAPVADAPVPACASGEARCHGSCVRLMQAHKHCGACDNACKTGEECIQGRCQQATQDCQNSGCRAGYYCDLNDNICKPGCVSDDGCAKGKEVCDLASNSCVCNSTHHRCGEQCVPNTSTTQCGSSCRRCPVAANATAVCVSGQCQTRCKTGFHRCGGACVPDTSVNACGASCTRCKEVSNGRVSCKSGRCYTDCHQGFRFCSNPFGCFQCCQDSDCASGSVCEQNKCIKGVRCQQSTDCGVDELCKQGFCQKQAEGAACQAHSDCPQGQICDNKTCKAQECYDIVSVHLKPANQKCPEGFRCQMSRCYDKTGASCKTWRDCGVGDLCEKGVCKKNTRGSSCTTEHCAGWGYRCMYGRCVSMTDRACRSRDDCGDDDYCTNSFDSKNIGVCKNNYYYVSGKKRCQFGFRSYYSQSTGKTTCNYVYHATCSEEWHCGGLKCLNGRCSMGGRCKTTADCRLRDSCVQGECKPNRTYYCKPGDDCGAGAYCASSSNWGSQKYRCSAR